MNRKTDRKPWIKKRHRTVRNILNVLLLPYTKLKYGIKIDKFKDESKRAYLILYNHQTPFDQFFVGMSFSDAVYYLATEDIFSNGLVSSVIRYLVAPIPIKKQTMDIKAIRSCIQVAREGGTIAIAPEGNRTYSGRTEHMSPSIAQLAKKLGLPIALYRIEGGYGVQPRWSDVIRRGKMHSYVCRVIEPEEYESLSNDELFELIRDGLNVNEAASDGEFIHRRRAEYIERLLYVCPFCGLSEFESRGSQFKCVKCKRTFTYEPNKTIKGVGFDSPFNFVADWYDYQNSFVLGLDLSEYEDTAMYSDRVRLSRVVVGKRKETISKNADISLYGNRITVSDKADVLLDMHFDGISSVAVLGRNKLNIYYGSEIYQIKGSKRFNAVKYTNIFYHYKGNAKGGPDGKFLGL